MVIRSFCVPVAPTFARHAMVRPFRTLVRSISFHVGLAAAIFFSPAAAVMAQQPGQNSPAQPAKADLRYATEQAFAGALVRPKQVFAAPEMAMLPYEVIQAAGLQEIGIDPLTIEELQVFVEPPMLGPPQFLAVARFADAFRLDQLKEQFTSHTQRSELDGRPYLQGTTPMEPSLFAPDDRTLLVGSDDMLRRAYVARGGTATSPLIDRLTRMDGGRDAFAAVEIAPIRPLLVAQVHQAPPFPPPLDQLEPTLRSAPDLIGAIEASLGITGGENAQGFSLVVYGADEAAAQELEKLAQDALKLWQEQMLAAFQEAEQSGDAVQQATARYMQRISGSMSDIYRPTREGERLVFFGGAGDEKSPQMQQIAIIGILVALILPAVQAAREAARRTQCRNNLRQLGLCLHNYHDVHKRFPAHANYDANGKPLLSWRVHILPFMEEQALYEQFHLDEPWDSEHNRTLIPLMPPFYACPSSPSAMAEHRSSYVAAVGEGLFMEGKEGLSIGAIKDGTSKTIMLVEVPDEHAPIWTAPDDVEIDRQNPAANLGSRHPGIFVALYADVHVEETTLDVDPVLLWKLFTRAGGEPTQR
jgi:hypothetical protein